MHDLEEVVEKKKHRRVIRIIKTFIDKIKDAKIKLQK